METKKSKIFPITITVILIVIIIYLFATVKQPLVVCDRKVQDDLDITVFEVLDTTINGNKIDKMVLEKTIILPEEYLVDDSQLDGIMFALEKSYQYLGEDKVTITKGKDRITVKVEVEDDETIILNNIEFFYNDELEMKVITNTKSSDVITLKVKDSYTEGELMTRLKNNGYSCK